MKSMIFILKYSESVLFPFKPLKFKISLKLPCFSLSMSLSLSHLSLYYLSLSLIFSDSIINLFEYPSILIYYVSNIYRSLWLLRTMHSCIVLLLLFNVLSLLLLLLLLLYLSLSRIYHLWRILWISCCWRSLLWVLQSYSWHLPKFRQCKFLLDCF